MGRLTEERREMLGTVLVPVGVLVLVLLVPCCPMPEKNNVLVRMKYPSDNNSFFHPFNRPLKYSQYLTHTLVDCLFHGEVSCLRL
jgi:hypothetical protein